MMFIGDRLQARPSNGPNLGTWLVVEPYPSEKYMTWSVGIMTFPIYPIGYPCMLYMVTFTINIPQMLAYIPYMDPMGMEKKNHVPNHQPVMFRPLKPSFLTNSNWSIRNTQCFGTPSGLPHAIALGTACTCTGVPHPRTHCLVVFRHLPYAKVSWNHHHDRLKENTPISYIRNSQACDSFPPLRLLLPIHL